MITTSHYRRSHCAIFLVNLKEEGRLDLAKELYEEYRQQNEQQYSNNVIFIANQFDQGKISIDLDGDTKAWKKAKEFCAANNVEIYEASLAGDGKKATDLVCKYLEAFVKANYASLLDEKRFVHAAKEKSGCALI